MMWIIVLHGVLVLEVLLVVKLFLYALRKPFVGYFPQDEDESQCEEEGWKMIHGDILRPPTHQMLFALCIGEGKLLLTVALIHLCTLCSIFTVKQLWVVYICLTGLKTMWSGQLLRFFDPGRWDLASDLSCSSPYHGPEVFWSSSLMRSSTKMPSESLGKLTLWCVLGPVLWFLLLNYFSQDDPTRQQFPIHFRLFAFNVPMLVMSGVVSATVGLVWAVFGPATKPPSARVNAIPRMIPSDDAWYGALGGIGVDGRDWTRGGSGTFVVQALRFAPKRWMVPFFLFGLLWTLPLKVSSSMHFMLFQTKFESMAQMWLDLVFPWLLFLTTSATCSVFLVFRTVFSENWEWWWRAFTIPARVGILLAIQLSYLLFIQEHTTSTDPQQGDLPVKSGHLEKVLWITFSCLGTSFLAGAAGFVVSYKFILCLYDYIWTHVD